MTKEEKQLLLRDLCARLPYEVKCQFEDTVRVTDGESDPFYDYVLSARDLELFINHKNFYIKPYLRPMSSITKEEYKEYAEVIVKSQDCSLENSESATTMANDWLLSKGFDVRGLISKGLALVAPNGMYN